MMFITLNTKISLLMTMIKIIITKKMVEIKKEQEEDARSELQGSKCR